MTSARKSGVFAALILGLLLVALAGMASASAGPTGQTGTTSAQATGTPVATVTPAPTLQAALPATPGPATQPLNQVSRTVAALYSNVDSFTGTLTMTLSPGGPNETTVEMRHWFKQPNMNRLEVLEGGQDTVPAGSELVFNDGTLTLYDPVDDVVFEIRNTAQLAQMLNLPQQQLRPLLETLQLQDFVSSLAANSRARIAGTVTVAGRPATVVELTPRTEAERFGAARVALDNETLVPLRIELMGDNNNTLLRTEYTEFNPQAEVQDERFTFEAPQDTNIVTLNPRELTNRFGFEPTTLEEARAQAEFTVLQPQDLPAGMSQQALRSTTVNDTTVVAFFYGDQQDTSTMLIERPSSLDLLTLRGGEAVTVDGTTVELYQAPLPGRAEQATATPTPSIVGTPTPAMPAPTAQDTESERMIVINWVQDDTALTLVTTRDREDALSIVRSIGP